MFQYLLKKYPGGTCQGDGNGYLPLHIACRDCTSLDQIRLLVDANLSAFFCQSRCGETPTMLAFRRANNDDINNYLLEKQIKALQAIREAFDDTMEQLLFPILSLQRFGSLQVRSMSCSNRGCKHQLERDD